MLAPVLWFNVGKRPGDTPEGIVHGVIDDFTAFTFEPVLLVPDIQRGLLHGGFRFSTFYYPELCDFFHLWLPFLMLLPVYSYSSLAAHGLLATRHNIL